MVGTICSISNWGIRIFLYILIGASFFHERFSSFIVLETERREEEGENVLERDDTVFERLKTNRKQGLVRGRGEESEKDG